MQVVQSIGALRLSNHRSKTSNDVVSFARRRSMTGFSAAVRTLQGLVAFLLLQSCPLNKQTVSLDSYDILVWICKGIETSFAPF